MQRDLARLPRLRLALGGTWFESWQISAQALCLPPVTSSIDVRIETGVEGGRVSLSAFARGARRILTSVSTADAELALAEILRTNCDASIELDGAGLGRIFVTLRRVRAENQRGPRVRIARWLKLAAGGSTAEPSSSGAFVMRMGRSRSSSRLLGRSFVASDSSLAPQLRALSRPPRSRR